VLSALISGKVFPPFSVSPRLRGEFWFSDHPIFRITEVTGKIKNQMQIRHGRGIVSVNEVFRAMQDHPQQASSGFTLKPGERITDCSPLWTSGSDRILEEIANCSHCPQPTYRVIILTSAAGLERRESLCVKHFVHAARTFQELRRQSA